MTMPIAGPDKVKRTLAVSLVAASLVIIGLVIALSTRSNSPTSNPTQVAACTKALSMADQIMADWRSDAVVLVEAGKSGLVGDYNTASAYLADAEGQIAAINSAENKYQLEEKICTG